jgi:hypothetical protein
MTYAVPLDRAERRPSTEFLKLAGVNAAGDEHAGEGVPPRVIRNTTACSAARGRHLDRIRVTAVPERTRSGSRSPRLPRAACGG